MLIWTGREWIANDDVFMLNSRSDTIRNEAVIGKISASNYIACTSC